METPDETLRPDELLAQLSWVRALARSLVADPEATDDVLQQVCLMALQQAPREARAGPRLRAWLATVTRTLVRNTARADGRRLRREEAAAQAEALPSTEDVAAHREVLKRLVEAMSALDEPHYAVLVARYLDGRSVGEIAARTGASHAAVRQRLSRARQQLRTRLEAQFPDEWRAWLAAALPLAPGAAPWKVLPAKPIVTSFGGLLVAKSVGSGGVVKVLAAIGLLALLFFGTWHTVSDTAHSDPRAPIADAAASEERADAGEAAIAARPVAPEPLVSQPATPDVAAVGGAAGLIRVHGRILEEPSRAPVAGADVVLFAPRPAMAMAGQSDRRELVRTLSDADGRFELSVEPPLPGLGRLPDNPFATPERPPVLATHAGFVAGFTALDGAGVDAFDVGDILLAIEATIHGRVQDATGAPLDPAMVAVRTFAPPGALLAAGAPRETQCPGIRVETARGGWFTVSGLPAGEIHVNVAAPGGLPQDLPPIALHAGEHIDLGTITLANGSALEGDVVSPDGQPVRDAWVMVLPPATFEATPDADLAGSVRAMVAVLGSSMRLHTDARGHFQSFGLAPGNKSLAVGAPGWQPAVVRLAPVPGPSVMVTLPARGSTLLAAVAAGTHEVLEVSSMVSLDPVTQERQQLARAAADGPFVCRNDGDVTVLVRCPGRPAQAFEVKAGTPGEQDSRELEIVEGARLRGTIARADGAPPPSCIVTAHPLDAVLERVEPARVVRSDERGLFDFGLVVPGRWVVSAVGEGLAEKDGGVALTPGQMDREVHLVLDASASIEGVVVDSSGVARAGTEVRILDFGRRQATAADETGHFRFGGLAKGSYRIATADGRGTQKVKVAAGAVTAVRIVVPEQATLAGLVRAGDARVPGARVVLLIRAFKESWLRTSDTVADADGSYRFEDLTPGDYQVYAESAGGRSARQATSLAESGHAILDLSLGVGSLQGDVVAAGSGEPLAGIAVSLDWKDQNSPFLATTDASGHFTFEHLSPGTAQLVLSGAGRGTRTVSCTIDPAQAVARVRVELQGAASVSGQLRTPDGQLPVGKFLVSLVPADESQARSALVDGGRYELPDLAPGTYDCRLMSHVFSVEVGWQDTLLDRTTITIAAGEPRVLDWLVR